VSFLRIGQNDSLNGRDDALAN